MMERFEMPVMNKVPGATAVGTKADKKTPEPIAIYDVENEDLSVESSLKKSSTKAYKNDKNIRKRKPWDTDETFNLSTNELQRYVINKQLKLIHLQMEREKNPD